MLCRLPAIAVILGAIAGPLEVPVEAAGVPGLSDTLYVVDQAAGEILAVDAGTGGILHTFAAGYKPDETLSPDGARLYVMSRGSRAIETFDAHSGASLARTDNSDIPETTMPWSGGRMIMSPSGRWIYILKLHQTPGIDDVYLAVFDTAKNAFLPNHISLGHGDCFSTRIVPTREDLTVDAVCGHSVMELSIASDGQFGSRPLLMLDPRRTRITTAALSPDARSLRLCTLDGQALSLDRTDGNLRELPSKPNPDRWRGGGSLSRDGQYVYFTGKPARTQFETQIERARTDTLITDAARSPDILFHNLCVSPRSGVVYITSPPNSIITAIDGASLTVLGSIHLPGRKPSWIVAAP